MARDHGHCLPAIASSHIRDYARHTICGPPGNKMRACAVSFLRPIVCRFTAFVQKRLAGGATTHNFSRFRRWRHMKII